jgi:hypothetical protein
MKRRWWMKTEREKRWSAVRRVCAKEAKREARRMDAVEAMPRWGTSGASAEV